MVLPGPGEVQLIGYDPNLPPASGKEPIEMYEEAQDQLDQTYQQNEDGEPEYMYMVTINIQLRAKSPIHAQISAMNGEHEPVHMSAERIE